LLKTLRREKSVDDDLIQKIMNLSLEELIYLKMHSHQDSQIDILSYPLSTVLTEAVMLGYFSFIIENSKSDAMSAFMTGTSTTRFRKIKKKVEKYLSETND